MKLIEKIRRCATESQVVQEVQDFLRRNGITARVANITPAEEWEEYDMEIYAVARNGRTTIYEVTGKQITNITTER